MRQQIKINSRKKTEYSIRRDKPKNIGKGKETQKTLKQDPTIQANQDISK